MKRVKLIRKITALVIGAMMTFAMGTTALAADSQVTYQGGADAFVMIPDSTNLFQNFSGVVPGDVLNQTITVKNTVSKAGGVRIYLRAESSDETINGFLRQMTLTVKEEDTVLSEGKADQSAGLTENVLLGYFSKNETVDLNVTLIVPITMGDEFQKASGTITWIFTAEELDGGGGGSGTGGGGGSSSGGGGPNHSDLTDTETTTITEIPSPEIPGSSIGESIPQMMPDNIPLPFLPKTGDPSKDAILLVINIASFFLIIGLAVRLIRRKKTSK